MKLKPLFGAIVLAVIFAATPAASADRLKVMLEWFVHPDHAPLVVAKQLGLFEQNGLDVGIVLPSDPSAVPHLVASGQVDIGMHYQPNLYLDHAAGEPIMRFGTLVETPLNSLITLADGPIASLADLKGKSVGYSVSGFEDALLGKMLENAGLNLSDVSSRQCQFRAFAVSSQRQGRCRHRRLSQFRADADAPCRP